MSWALHRGRALFVVISLLLLVPCYWQPRLQAADISSHINNSWMSQLIESGRTEGILVVRQTTNVLFGLMLDGLFRILGAELAQRIAVSIVVLVFVWGAFAFVSTVVGRRPWHVLPCLAMLAYGWVFHMGFFNFYLSLGLCFSAMSLCWNMSGRRMLWAVPLWTLAYLAFAIPLIWSVGLLCYVYFARRMSPFHRICLTGGFVFFQIGIYGVVGRSLMTRWSAAQLATVTGIDQVWVADSKYYWVLMGLALVWGFWFLSLVRGRGARQVVASIPFQLCLISAAAVFILPWAVLIPGFFHSLSYIAERMSLGVAVCVCALLGTVDPRRLERWMLAAVAATFFIFMFADERANNSTEDRLQELISHSEASVRPEALACQVAGGGEHDHQVPHHQSGVPISCPPNQVLPLGIDAQGAQPESE
jgi:hypothetical protein